MSLLYKPREIANGLYMLCRLLSPFYLLYFFQPAALQNQILVISRNINEPFYKKGENAVQPKFKIHTMLYNELQLKWLERTVENTNDDDL